MTEAIKLVLKEAVELNTAITHNNKTEIKGNHFFTE